MAKMPPWGKPKNYLLQLQRSNSLLHHQTLSSQSPKEKPLLLTSRKKSKKQKVLVVLEVIIDSFSRFQKLHASIENF